MDIPPLSLLGVLGAIHFHLGKTLNHSPPILSIPSLFSLFIPFLFSLSIPKYIGCVSVLMNTFARISV